MSGTNDNTPMNEANLSRIEQDYSPVNDLGKLVLKIAKNCARQELHTVYDALEMLIITVLEQIPDDALRNQHAARLIHRILFLRAFEHIQCDERAGDSGEITDSEDQDVRIAHILGKIKVLSDLSVALPKQAPARGYLKLLRRRYKIDDGREVRDNFNDLHDVFALAASIIGGIPEKDSRMQVILMYIQAFISMANFDDIETDKLKQVLRAVADIPNEDFREDASLNYIEKFVNALNETS